MESEKVKRKAWYQVKIEELEARVAELSSVHTTSTNEVFSELVVKDGSFNDGFADGYVECMHKYGILSKVIRRRTHEMLKLKGPGAVKATKRTRFGFSVPSL